MPSSESLERIIREAHDIATATEQKLASAHILLAFYTVKNEAQTILRDAGVDENALLDAVAGQFAEPKDALQQILSRAAQVAAGCGARRVGCLHALVAITRAKESTAFQLLEKTGINIAKLRTRSLSVLTGAIPLWFADEENIREAASHVRRSRRPSRKSVRSSLPRPGMSSALEWTPPVIDSARRPRSSPLAAPPRRPSRPVEAPPVRSAPKPAPRLPSEPPVVARERSVRPDPIVTDKPEDMAMSWALSPEDYPWLSSLGRNLSAEAARGELDEVEGRELEISTIIDVLGKRRANNPCLLGEPGVGKTAVVEALALRLVRSPRSMPLSDRIIVELDVGSLLIGTHLRGSFSEKLQGIREEVKQSDGRVVIFFDELHTLVGAGSAGDGAQDAANELKSALAKGDFPCIGATTLDEWKKHVEPDAALKRRFFPVVIREPDAREAIKMIGRIAPAYAEHHGVTFGEEAIEGAVKLSVRFIVDRYLPDKAIALLDLAGSRAARAGLENVTIEHIAEIVAEQARIPKDRVLASDRERLLALEDHLAKKIVGHSDQIARIADVVRRNAAGFGSQRPQGSFLFLGPTGVGKTETAREIAVFLHGSYDNLLRFDLSEYSESHSVARLVGAPPGYIGYDAGGQLTEAVRRRPSSVVLLDEIEKAHPDVLQLLLQILDDGRLTDGNGRTVSFAETIVVMTSNLGGEIAHTKAIGFGDHDAVQSMTDRALELTKKQMPPELWGRIDEKLVFAPLTEDEIRTVTRRLAHRSSERLLGERGIGYSLDDEAVEFLLEQGGFDNRLGARPMRQILSRIVEAPIAARILEGRLHADEHVFVSTREDGSLAFLVGEERTSLSQRPAR